MFKKGIAALGCVAVMAAGWSYAATTWQLQTKLNTAGGNIQVRDKAPQTTSGSIVYNNFTTSALVPVTVYPKPGYKISSVKKGGVEQAIADNQLYTTNFAKSTTTQALVASFTANQYTVTGAAVGNGSISPASATVSYNGTVVFSASPSATGNTVLTSVSAGTLTDAATGAAVTLPTIKPVKITLSGIQAAQTVTATYATVSVSAGADKVVLVDQPATIRGSVSGSTLIWSQVSGPAEVTLTNPTSTTPSFTPTALGTYVFKATDVLAGVSDTVEVTATTDVKAYMQNACDGCHNATNGVFPSTAFDKWSVSKHADHSISCVSCHTDGAMPTPVNTSSVEADTFKVLNSSAGTVGNNYCAKCHSSVTHIAAVAPNNTCTRCHTGGQHNPATFFSYFDAAIADMHVFGKATPGTAEGTAKTQFVTQGAVCEDCHNGHGTNPQLESFAESGHGKVSNDPMNPFTHYDWSARTNNGTRQNGNCDRCHTAGGFVKFTGDDAALAARLAPKSGVANNVLVCVACHTDLATGALRTGATPAGNRVTLAEGYFALFSSAAPTAAKKQGEVAANKTKIEVAFPGMKNSSICIPCHSGRSTDDQFVAVIDQMKLVGGNYTTISTSYYQHAANMGQSFIGKGAFNFNSGEYVGANGHAAVKNGAADTQGPCVGCHYSKDGADHSLEPVGYSTVCQSCHAAPFGAADVEEKKAEYEAGLAILDKLIRAKFDGLRVNTSAPLETERAMVRFGRFNKAAGVAADDTTAKKAYGAWYNWQLLSVWDSAMFAHNPTFARTVLNDTIDYLDDGSLNGTAAATLAASTYVTPEEAAKAAEFVETPACASCHSAQATLVQSGKHAVETSTHSGSCGRCHTAEGYVAFLATGQNPAGVYSTSYNGSQNVSCAACHDQHGTVRDVAWAPQPKDTQAPASAEYKLCTSCHNLTNANGDIMASGVVVNGQATVAMQQHNKDWYRNIASTHYDLTTTGTVTNVGTLIEGYNVRYNAATACTDCHGHEFYTNSAKALEVPSATDPLKGAGTVQTEWAASGHAGQILKVKFTAFTTANAGRSRTTTTHAAVMGAGVTAASGIAWEHYNWDDSTGTANDRKGCQKCHTATGAANFLNNPAAYDPANNNFSHLAQWATAKVSPQNEVLYCWGCHNNVETGALRNAGSIPSEYTFKGASFSFADAGASNVCFACHAGRTGGDNITALTAAGNNFTNVSFVNSHYMAAAGLMYAKIGYTNFIDPNTVIGSSTYGKSLTTPEDGGSLTSTHRKLGTAAIVGDHGIVAEDGLNAGGPCAACHYAKGTHELEIGKVAFESVCVKCHDEEAGTPLTASNFKELFIEEQAVPFQNAIAVALKVLDTNYNIRYDGSAHPYFYDKNLEAAGKTGAAAAVKDWTRGGALTAAQAEKLMGACFNINVLKRDPAAYAHARTYARRLLYDSIDFLDDKTINMSTGATAIAVDPVKYVKDSAGAGGTTTESFKYLAGYNRTTLVWNALERP